MNTEPYDYKLLFKKLADLEFAHLLKLLEPYEHTEQLRAAKEAYDAGEAAYALDGLTITDDTPEAARDHIVYCALCGLR